MLITRKSSYSGIERTLDLNVNQEQIDAWQNGALIQNVMPQLSPDEREFLITGITNSEWQEAFSNIDDELTNN